MVDKRSILQEIDDLRILDKVTKSYAEIASKRMKSIRGKVVTNRGFLESIKEIFDEVRSKYREEVAKALKRRGTKRGGKLTFLTHNGKSVAVFLGANTGLYGDIVQKVFNQFLRDIREKDYEATVVGKLGKSLFLGAEPDRLYTYFELPDFGMDQEGLGEVMKHLVQYETVRVYFGQFYSVARQEAEVLDISAQTPVAGGEVEQKKTKRNYLFEPGLEKILTFFEAQMFSNLFEQTVRESQLSKFASRMLSMDKAGESIKERLGVVSLTRSRLYHRELNRKQQTALVSILNQ